MHSLFLACHAEIVVATLETCVPDSHHRSPTAITLNSAVSVVSPIWIPIVMPRIDHRLHEYANGIIISEFCHTHEAFNESHNGSMATFGSKCRIYSCRWVELCTAKNFSSPLVMQNSFKVISFDYLKWFVNNFPVGFNVRVNLDIIAHGGDVAHFCLEASVVTHFASDRWNPAHGKAP